jgi:hypothetical protein
VYLGNLRNFSENLRVFSNWHTVARDIIGPTAAKFFFLRKLKDTKSKESCKTEG